MSSKGPLHYLAHLFNPWLKSLLAILAGGAAVYWQNAPQGLRGAVGGVLIVLAVDLVLGTTRAILDGELNVKRAMDSCVKLIIYGSAIGVGVGLDYFAQTGYAAVLVALAFVFFAEGTSALANIRDLAKRYNLPVPEALEQLFHNEAEKLGHTDKKA